MAAMAGALSRPWPPELWQFVRSFPGREVYVSIGPTVGPLQATTCDCRASARWSLPPAQGSAARGDRLRPRGRAGAGHRHRRARPLRAARRGAVRTAELDVTDGAAVAAAARRSRAGRRAVQLRRLRPRRHHPRLRRGRLAFSFDLNVTAMYRMIRGVPARHARARRRLDRQHVLGCLRIKGVPNRFVYGATKAAVIGLTKAIAADFVDAAASAATRSARARWIRRRSQRAACGARRRRRGGARRASSPASRWGAWAPPKRSPRSRVYLATRRIGVHHRPAPCHRRRLVNLN